jgi:hypothetical protein
VGRDARARPRFEVDFPEEDRERRISRRQVAKGIASGAVIGAAVAGGAAHVSWPTTLGAAPGAVAQRVTKAVAVSARGLYRLPRPPSKTPCCT